MNRYLLAGCAAAALALGAGAANAQAKFEVKVGGDAYFEGGWVDQDRDTNLRSVEFRNRFRVIVTPTAKADNGLEYGGRIRMRANAGSAASGRTMDADRGYIFAQGAFGQVQMGVTNSFNDATYVTAPQDYLPLAIYDGVTAWIGGNAVAGADIGGGLAGLNGSILNQSLVVENNSTKIVYFSPRFAGLQLGASYTPRNDSSAGDVNRIEPTAGVAGSFSTTFQDMVEVGANYSNTFGGVAVKASAGYYWGDAANATVAGTSVEDLNAWQVGAQVGYAGFAIGGSYTDFGESGQVQGLGTNNDKSRVWVVGAQYTAGPIVVGANYKNGQDAGSLLTPGKRKLEVYEVGAGYTVAPGLTLQAQYDYFEAKSDLVNRDDEGHVVLVRTVLAF
ncbi:major outer membrane protein OmaA [Azospirillum argentinense]|uniref:Major outer membrane protein OmaA n=1 Tax=Azospirillum argentinense TaxID=2970906 RepID=A0A060DFX0_9PROT|nr:porin [Azospirillum argentinense]AIB13076.1 major outer membrane protein OmaA [Azospirillum argentinense]EZQ07310.1 major outer membrane protein OmaA [Azospirillum argentinense]MBK3799115.1 porin [Azospirillum argentinense]PNQ98201.1 porin [Azospirillum argentinense]